MENINLNQGTNQEKITGEIEKIDGNGRESISQKGIWRPGIFEGEAVAYGGLTKKIMDEESRVANPDGPVYKILADLERLDKPNKEKIKAARLLITALKEIDPEADPHDIIKTKLEHTDNSQVVSEKISELSRDERHKARKELIKRLVSTDGIMTDKEHVPLYVTGADCSPIAIYDGQNHAAGLFHSGWRGILAGNVIKGLQKMKDEYGTDAETIKVSIGPSLAQEDYEIDENIFNQFSQVFDENEMSQIFEEVVTASNELEQNAGKPKKWRMNGVRALELQLLKIGVKPENIESSGFTTTRHGHLFPSARKAGGISKIDGTIYMLSLGNKPTPAE